MWILTRTKPREIVNVNSGVRIRLNTDAAQHEIFATYTVVSYAEPLQISLGVFPDKTTVERAFEDLAECVKSFETKSGFIFM